MIAKNTNFYKGSDINLWYLIKTIENIIIYETFLENQKINFNLLPLYNKIIFYMTFAEEYHYFYCNLSVHYLRNIEKYMYILVQCIYQKVFHTNYVNIII